MFQQVYLYIYKSLGPYKESDCKFRMTEEQQRKNAMGITGVGSSYNFVYNTKTGKLSTKDGSKNEFVDFCNGDVKGEDTETLNHFDEHTRYQFTRMLFAYGTGMTGQNPFANDEKVEITADIDSATHTSFYVNGQKAFTAITGMSYLPSEIQTFGTVQQPFKTRGYKPYDPSTNSITIGVGSRFNLGNGYSMTVQEDFVWGEGYGNGSKADDERCNMMIGGLSSLIHFADQQYFSSMTDTYTDYILDFLASQGVDTSREFVINGTHCELVNGKIREVGNDYVVPSSIQQKAVKRYEERMAQLLKDGNWYRMAQVKIIRNGLPKTLDDLLNNPGGNLIYQDYASDIREILAYKQTQHKDIMSELNVQFFMADGTIQIKK